MSGDGEVKYAGSVRFGNNDGPSRVPINQWTNNSGYYQSLAILSGNSGLLHPKNGKHMGEVDFEFNQTKPADTTGRHNLKIK